MSVHPSSIHTANPSERYARFHDDPTGAKLEFDQDLSNVKPEFRDLRSRAQHDRDRILHSSAFKRLAGVTQVVDPTEGQIFHNRLTHSLKVSQIARRIAEKFLKDPKTAEFAKLFDINPDIVEAASLAHDLGHPPFGHLAELELNHLLDKAGLPDAFEGNAQTFRILNQLELRKLDHDGFGEAGLDLTRATLNAVMKYPWRRDLNQHTSDDQSNKKYYKWGTYLTEAEEFKWVREGWPNDIRSVEAEIMDFADDITYSLHDLEDFSRAGLIPITKLMGIRETRREFIKEILLQNRIIKDINDPNLTKEEKSKYEDLIYDLLDFMLIAPTGDPNQSTGDNQAKFHSWQSIFITRYVNSIDLVPEALTDASRRTIKVQPMIPHEITLLKGLTQKYVINSRQLATQQHGKREVIRRLYTILMRALIVSSRDSNNYDRYVLPEDYRNQLTKIHESLEKQNIDSKKAVHARFVADMISSMTDTEALAMHKRLTGVNPGSVLDIVTYSGFHLH